MLWGMTSGVGFKGWILLCLAWLALGCARVSTEERAAAVRPALPVMYDVDPDKREVAAISVGGAVLWTQTVEGVVKRVDDLPLLRDLERVYAPTNTRVSGLTSIETRTIAS